MERKSYIDARSAIKPFVCQRGVEKLRFRVRNVDLNLLRKRDELETSYVSELLPFIGETGCLVM